MNLKPGNSKMVDAFDSHGNCLDILLDSIARKIQRPQYVKTCRLWCEKNVRAVIRNSKKKGGRGFFNLYYVMII